VSPQTQESLFSGDNYCVCFNIPQFCVHIKMHSNFFHNDFMSADSLCASCVSVVDH
jgi:hypothetical protein